MVSTERTSPAPLDVQTENVSVLRPASRASAACFHHPYAKMPQWKIHHPTKKANFRGCLSCSSQLRDIILGDDDDDVLIKE